MTALLRKPPSQAHTEESSFSHIENMAFLRGLNSCFPRNALRFSIANYGGSPTSKLELIENYLLFNAQKRQQLRERILGSASEKILSFLLGVISLLSHGEITGTSKIALARVVDDDQQTVAIAWPDEEQAKSAVGIVQQLILGGLSPELSERIAKFRSKLERLADRPSLSVILEAADRKGVPWVWNERLNLCQLGHGYRRQWANDTISGKMSALGYHVARQKPTTNQLLTAHAIPVARQMVVTNMHEAEAAAEAISYPVVVKPETGHKGIGVTVGVANITELARAVATAKRSGTKVIIEAFVPGRDVRMLVVNGRMVAAAMRSAPTVKGDGLATIEQLIKRENARRTQEIGRALPISIDAPLRSTLAKASLSLTDILPHGKVVALRSVANWSRGGIATDVTVDVHPDNADMAVRAAQAVGLDVAGVDFITPDISRPYYEVGGAICEVNYRPGLRVHLAANPDCRTQLGEALLCNMFSNDGRIPVIAVLSPAKQGVAAVVDNALRQSGRNSRVIDFNDEGATFTNIVERYLADIDCEALVIAAPPEVVLAQGLGVDYCDLVIHSALPGKVEGAALEIVAARVHIVDDSSASSAGDIAAKVIDLLRHEPLPWRLPPLQLQPSRVKSIIGVAQKLGLSVNEMVRWSDAPIQRLGHGISQARYRSARTGQTSYIATTIADDKRRTNFVLQTHGLPVVLQQTVRSLSQARLAADRIGLPIVVKPAGSSESRGVSGMISTIDELSWAIKRASRHDDRFIIEPHLAGHDHRFLVVSGKAVHVTRHDPAHVIGDGKSMISELIDTENLNELRGPDKAQPYESLKLTDDALRTLEQQGLSPSSVPAAGAKIRLSSINSLSTGATAVDVTSVAHPLNIAAAERAARLIGLDICGVDFLLTDVARPYTEAGGAILEVNQRPAFDMHDAATNWNNVVRETVVRCMMAERSSSVPVLRMRTSSHTHTVEQVRQLTTGLSEAMGKTVGLVMPGGEGAAIRGSWLPQLNGDSAGVVRGLLADQRLEMVIFLDRDGADSVVPRDAATLPGQYDLSAAQLTLLQVDIASTLAADAATNG